jgi:N-acetylmuramic acid 6-phosphate etherase
MRRVLAVDCGGTESTALLIDGDEPLEQAVVSAGNLYVAGPDGVAALVLDLLHRLPAAEAVALSVAGLRTEDDRRALIGAMRRLGIELPVAAYPDTLAALRASGSTFGAVVVAGTGSAACAIGSNGRLVRVGGWGHLLGDEGSGYWIGHALLRRVTRAWDEGDPTPGPLDEEVLQTLGLPDLDALRSLALDPSAKSKVASLVPLAASLWRKGEAGLATVLEGAADELARLALLAAKRAQLPTPAPLVLAGGVFKALPELTDLITARGGGRFQVSTLTLSPAWGALALARERNDWDRSSALPPSPTEASNPRTVTIDSVDTLTMLRTINEEDARVAPAVGRALGQIARVVDQATSCLSRGGRLVYVGAGTSGRLAMLDAVECVPTFGTEPDLVRAIVAGGEAALTRAVEGAEDDADAGAAALAELDVSTGDIVVGVSASGGAEYVRAAVREARRRGAYTAFLTCNPRANLNGLADQPVVVDVGPEVIAGSTRLKAGTAQKLVLNMISTATMVRLGRTLGNTMVSMRPTNRKLRTRAVRLVCRLTGASSDVAEQALEASHWSVGEAALTVELGSLEAARESVREAGDLRRALLAAGIGASELLAQRAAPAGKGEIGGKRTGGPG